MRSCFVIWGGGAAFDFDRVAINMLNPFGLEIQVHFWGGADPRLETHRIGILVKNQYGAFSSTFFAKFEIVINAIFSSILTLLGMPRDAPGMQLDFLNVSCKSVASDQCYDQKRFFHYHFSTGVGDPLGRLHGAARLGWGTPLGRLHGAVRLG